MGGKGSGTREKPTCKKCGQAHWLFVRCEDGPADNDAEALRKRQRDGTMVQVPISRAQSRPAVFIGRNFVEQAPGVYRRRRRG